MDHKRIELKVDFFQRDSYLDFQEVLNFSYQITESERNHAKERIIFVFSLNFLFFSLLIWNFRSNDCDSKCHLDFIKLLWKNLRSYLRFQEFWRWYNYLGFSIKKVDGIAKFSVSDIPEWLIWSLPKIQSKLKSFKLLNSSSEAQLKIIKCLICLNHPSTTCLPCTKSLKSHYIWYRTTTDKQTSQTHPNYHS